MRVASRATSTVIVLSSLLLASAVAGPAPRARAGKKAPAKAAGSAGKDTTGAAPPSGATASGPSDASPIAAAGSGSGIAAEPQDLSSVKPEDMPTAVRMRRLEQKTQALKERAWQLKARVQMLKEQVLGGGVGAQAVISHGSEMGASFRLVKLVYVLDGAQVFARTDDTAESLYRTQAFDVFAGPIAPGSHNLSVIATYRGHGYGVFEYLSKYTFTAHGNQAFVVEEGKVSKVDCRGFEKGGPTTPLEKRAAIACKVTQVQPERPPEKSPENSLDGAPEGTSDRRPEGALDRSPEGSPERSPERSFDQSPEPAKKSTGKPAATSIDRPGGKPGDRPNDAAAGPTGAPAPSRSPVPDAAAGPTGAPAPSRSPDTAAGPTGAPAPSRSPVPAAGTRSSSPDKSGRSDKSGPSGK